MAYFVPGDPAAGGTEERSPARGDLRLLSPSTTASNLVFYASHSYYDALSSAGVKIYECQDALLHAKAVFIEGGLAILAPSDGVYFAFSVSGSAPGLNYT